MLTQNIQENTSNLGGFLNVRKQEQCSMPLALLFLFSAIEPKSVFSPKIESIYKLSIRIKKRFEIVVDAIFSFNGRRHG